MYRQQPARGRPVGGRRGRGPSRGRREGPGRRRRQRPEDQRGPDHQPEAAGSACTRTRGSVSTKARRSSRVARCSTWGPVGSSMPRRSSTTPRRPCASPRRRSSVRPSRSSGSTGTMRRSRSPTGRAMACRRRSTLGIRRERFARWATWRPASCISMPPRSARRSTCHSGASRTRATAIAESGTAAIEQFTETKTVFLDYSGTLQRAHIDEPKG